MADGGIRVRTSTEVAVLTRARIIGHIAREIAAVFNPTSSVLDTVLRGFSEGYLEKLVLVLRDSQKESVGYMSLEVDWSQYSITLHEGHGSNSFRLDPGKSVTGQVAPVLAKVIAYMSAASAERGVVSCKAVYHYRRDRRDEGRKVLKTIPLTEEDKTDLAKVQSKVKLVATDSELGEMTLSFGLKRDSETTTED